MMTAATTVNHNML